ncbi:hypothetical protein H632_c4147p0 [Helicosporidium sp. ATCC 50920]|nr:hypothetical protein H632_c4147p0 [Helicosporidium sp. ATCC 50920]|eukprot:KDD71932.1 hypothetical protein H632_c4147p0 [Helicosporidium sp. ATCC 50920]
MPTEYEGRAYFVDPETYEHLWEKPASLSWEVKVNEAGEAYYHNTATGDSTSNKPAMYGWSKAAVHTEL